MLVKDTKLLDSKLSLTDVQHLFHATASCSVGGGGGGGVVPEFSQELMAPQFVEALVRLADTKFQMLAIAWHGENGEEQKREGGEVKLLTLSQCLEKLLDEFIIPYACRSDADRFRRDLSRMEVKAVFRRHRDSLQQLFKKWCIVGEEVMDASQFRSFARDRNFLSQAFTESELLSVFQKIQDDEGALLASAGGLQLHHDDAKEVGSKSGDSKKKDADQQQEAIAMGHLNDEMTFSEFCEALAAIAVFKDPDPYLPLHQKLEQFVCSNVLGKLSGDD
jgi:hypothetical protein